MDSAEPSLQRLAIVAAALIVIGFSVESEATCHPKFARINGHSACFPGNGSSPFTDSEKQAIVDKHNGYRATVDPEATNMMKLRWDDEIAMIAQKWAENCSTLNPPHEKNHKRNIPGRFTLGQNVASNFGSILLAIEGWHSETKDFTYNSSNSFGAVGHYTQVVWATTTLIGCGEAMCYNGRRNVCNYGHAGNLGDWNKPYKIGGARCSACPENCQDNALCDCNRTCLNRGTLNPETCACSCFGNGIYQPPNCTLVCSLTKQHSACPQPCSNFRDYCPISCEVCPTAGEYYTTTPVPTTMPTTTTTPTTSTTPGAAAKPWGLPFYAYAAAAVFLRWIC